MARKPRAPATKSTQAAAKRASSRPAKPSRKAAKAREQVTAADLAPIIPVDIEAARNTKVIGGLGPVRKFTERQIAKALRAAGGNLTMTCRLLQETYGQTLTRANLRANITASPRLMAIREEVEDVVLDYAEAANLKLMEAGDRASIHFHLRWRGASRGYATNVKHSGDAAAPIHTETTIDFKGLTIDELRLMHETLAKAKARERMAAEEGAPPPPGLITATPIPE